MHELQSVEGSAANLAAGRLIATSLESRPSPPPNLSGLAQHLVRPEPSADGEAATERTTTHPRPQNPRAKSSADRISRIRPGLTTVISAPILPLETV